MTYYNKLLPWENARRIEKLAECRGYLLDYFNNVTKEWRVDDPIENEAAQRARVLLNRNLDDLHDCIVYAGIPTGVTYTPPPAVGGYRQTFDVVQNVFGMHRYSVSPNHVLDLIDRAIGVYDRNRRSAVIRVINPLFYVGVVFDWVARLPFKLLGRAGFDAGKAEESIIGRLVKGVIYLIGAIASLLTVLELIGLGDQVKAWGSRLLG